MKSIELASIAKQITSTNCYMVLATNGSRPWAAVVYYCQDKQHNFYFMSQMTSLHSKHILKNHQAAFAIFDSHQPEGTGNGGQGYGKAELLSPKQSVEAVKWYHTSFPVTPAYRFFKISPIKYFILDPEVNEDKRIEVKL